MADKILNIRVNVKALKKEWFFKGEKGEYADMVVFYNEEKDQYESNGMVIQSVPKKVREEEKDRPKHEQTRGPILGNCFEFVKGSGVRDEQKPEGFKTSPGATGEDSEDDDDLPF